MLRIEVRWWDFYKRRWTTLWLMRNVYTRYKAVLEHLRGRNRAHKGSEALGSYMSEGGGAIFSEPCDRRALCNREPSILRRRRRKLLVST